MASSQAAHLLVWLEVAEVVSPQCGGSRKAWLSLSLPVPQKHFCGLLFFPSRLGALSFPVALLG